MFKNLLKRYSVLTALFAFSMFIFVACSDSTTEPTVDESKLLIEYLESSAGGDYINTSGWSMTTAADVKTAITADPTSMYLVDIRAAADFEKGHVAGAVNVQMKDLLTYYTTNNLSGKAKIVLICYSGQSAAYAASLLQLYGYKNVVSMKFGMSAWHTDFNSWKTKITNEYYTQWNTTDVPKPANGALPVISTGKTTGKEILEARVATLLTEGFGTASVSAATMYGAMSDYFVVAYWSNSDYLKGHVNGSVNYLSKSSLKTSTTLYTLPANKKIAVYCYTGHTAAFAVAFLKVMGYDAKSVLYGGNGMAYQFMLDNKMSAYKDTDCMDYTFVK